MRVRTCAGAGLVSRLCGEYEAPRDGAARTEPASDVGDGYLSQVSEPRCGGDKLGVFGATAGQKEQRVIGEAAS